MSEEKKDGGPAFPGTGFDTDGRVPEGMSLRDWFAAHALNKALQGRGPEDAAKRAYEIADAMLAAREAK